MSHVPSGFAHPQVQQRIQELVQTDPFIAAILPDKHLYESLQDTSVGIAEKLESIFTRYSDRTAFGERAWTIENNQGIARRKVLPEFTTYTYAHIWKLVQLCGSWLQQHSHTGSFLASMGFASVQYAILDYASIYAGMSIVPLQSGLSAEQTAPIVQETSPGVMAVSMEYIESLREAIVGQDSIRDLIVFDYCAQDEQQQRIFSQAQQFFAQHSPQLNVITFEQIIAEQENKAIKPSVTITDKDHIYRILYTSGSTGTPKGAVYTYDMYARLWSDTVDVPVVMVHYMPMSHVYGIAYIMRQLTAGGVGYFTGKSDQSLLFEDNALAQPTIFNAVPRLFDIIYQRYNSQLSKRTEGITDSVQLREIEAEVKDYFRKNELGGRLVAVVSASAPISTEMCDFIEDLLQFPIINGYGSTETHMVLSDGWVDTESIEDIKLIDVPELGYLTSDTPYPRGELLVKPYRRFAGYYKREDITASVVDDDGFYKTGDVMEQIAPHRYRYLDRRNNVIKLSQGEFVAISQLEAQFATSTAIAQIYIYGSSEQSFLLAVIVPTADLRELYVQGQQEQVRHHINSSIQQIVRDHHLQPYQVPRDFIVETVPFTKENGLLSGIAKLLRPAVKAKYQDRLEELYTILNSGQQTHLDRLRDKSSTDSVSSIVVEAAAITVGVPKEEVSEQTSFNDLGGDSLSALSFSRFLEDIFGVEVPVQVIVGPTASLAGVADFIEKNISGSQRPTVASIHGKDTQQLRASDLTLDKFIDDHILSQAREIQYENKPIKTVLLTGANGYLGRFLALQWLERLVPIGGTLICVVRAANEDQALARIFDAIGEDDPVLTEHFKQLAKDHLQIVIGDLAEPHLGIDDAQWQFLTRTVDYIVHCGALVNHVLPYTQLFGPNVLGTTELIGLSLTNTIKPISFLSTVSVVDKSGGVYIPEDGDIREANPLRNIDDGYANGYGVSKWASEVLLREAHEQFNVPVTVFRSDMILAHRKYFGQYNPIDAFTRLISSVGLTHLAPADFYNNSYQGESAKAHYDGLPVDFTAAAITTIGAEQGAGHHTYNVFNSHKDGISLNTFVDWMIELGVQITKIDDYHEWFTRFRDALHELPKEQKNASVLPLLHAYTSPLKILESSPVPAENFRAKIQEIGVNGENDVPHLDKQLIAQYVSGLKHHGLL